MSVVVEQLTKTYGAQKAVNQLSFEAQKGEIVGFLGPNGAGKTTTMKILTSYIPKSSGKATVCGFDVEENSTESRRRIGYLPEHNPLYKDMYVKEYLLFIARLHKEVSNKRQRVQEMIEQTGLGREQHKKIGMLSKGYRQRVGLAQAMLHNPKVLILDEPTSGLDPNQLVEIRSLIQQLGKEKTVIFSTHIMQEEQAICDRVLIINKGKLVANDPIQNLQNRVKGSSLVSIEFKEDVKTAQLQAIEGVQEVKNAGKRKWQLISSVEEDIRADVFKFAVANQLTLLEIRQEVFSVEDIFQKLTANEE
ncbi:MAG: gliding motility-associated ABC transporter ATP-binding subunit GldA [Bacteroidota bacterium]